MDKLKAYDLGFKAGWRAAWGASGEGFNGEYPDEGVPWSESAGFDAYRRYVGESVYRDYVNASEPTGGGGS